MGPVGLSSRDTGTLPWLAGGLSGLEAPLSPHDSASLAVAADETPIVFSGRRNVHSRLFLMA